jgi:hypothetical protein
MYSQNFVRKLRAHILPRVKAVLQQERTSLDLEASGTSSAPASVDNSADPNCVLFQSNRIYKHNLLRINYTTYDVRRSQDVINPNTPHCDIMLLSEDDDTDSHCFRYARVLGIYHVNTVYTGPEMLDYTPRRLDFLWVRWFQHIGIPARWEEHRLDSVCFPPVANQDAFGFVDPKDVLRGCHFIPNFRHGQVHHDAISLSRCARDGQDWQRYNLNRYVGKTPASLTPFTENSLRFLDRDMLMRFHWGLAVGHIYTHNGTSHKAQPIEGGWDDASTPEAPDTSWPMSGGGGPCEGVYSLEEEYSLEDHDYIDWDEGSDRDDDGDGCV